MVLYFLLSIVMGLYSAGIAQEKKRNLLEGFVLGFFLNLFGVLIETFLPKKKRSPSKKQLCIGKPYRYGYETND